MKITRILLGLGVCSLAISMAGAQVTAENSTVTIIVSDTLGLLLKDASVVLTSVGPKEAFTAVGGEAKFKRIPFGLYDLEMRLPGFPTRKDQIRVYQSSLVFRIGLGVPTTHAYQRPVLSGTISNAKNLLDLWVRLMPVYSSDLVENAVNSEGKFELAGMEPGPALLMVFQKDKLMATKAINVLGNSQQVTLALEK